MLKHSESNEIENNKEFIKKYYDYICSIWKDYFRNELGKDFLSPELVFYNGEINIGNMISSEQLPFKEKIDKVLGVDEVNKIEEKVRKINKIGEKNHSGDINYLVERRSLFGEEKTLGKVLINLEEIDKLKGDGIAGSMTGIIGLICYNISNSIIEQLGPNYPKIPDYYINDYICGYTIKKLQDLRKFKEDSIEKVLYPFNKMGEKSEEITKKKDQFNIWGDGEKRKQNVLAGYNTTDDQLKEVLKIKFPSILQEIKREMKLYKIDEDIKEIKDFFSLVFLYLTGRNVKPRVKNKKGVKKF